MEVKRYCPPMYKTRLCRLCRSSVGPIYDISSSSVHFYVSYVSGSKGPSTGLAILSPPEICSPGAGVIPPLIFGWVSLNDPNYPNTSQANAFAISCIFPCQAFRWMQTADSNSVLDRSTVLKVSIAVCRNRNCFLLFNIVMYLTGVHSI